MNWKKLWASSPVPPWVALFLGLALAVTQYGGTNARARIAALRAMTEARTLHIDAYADWTFDWSLAPSGHYYSNKAPGGVLLGYPVFAALDYPVLLFNQSYDENGRAPEPGYLELTLFNLLMQLLPFSFLVLYASSKLEAQGVPRAGVHFFALTALLGNTAAIYMNCYFGHGLAALLFLAGFLAWLERKYLGAAFFLAATMLTDYGGACLIPFFVLATLWRERSWKPLLPIALGAAPCGLLWIWYHTVVFGGPLEVASKFINPTQLVPVTGGDNLWGTMGIFPIPSALYGLLFGPERGILFTQPWVLVGLPLLVFFLPRGAGFFLGGGFFAMLWMNASVGGWYGGYTLGPRYLSLFFPAFALALAWNWARLPQLSKYFLWVGLAVALAFRAWTYPFSNLAPMENLWAYHAGKWLTDHPGTNFLRLGMVLVFSAAAFAWWRTRERRTSN